MTTKHSLMILRKKFADDLEEILQCPVCCENLSVPVPTCFLGHHVCVKCQEQMLHCPFCKSDFNGTRNFLAETLIAKFQEIKISLLNPKHSINKKVIEGKICIHTQTDPSFLEKDEVKPKSLLTDQSNNVLKENLDDLKIDRTVGKGTYPCKIDDCDGQFPHGRMIPHIRYYHKENLIEEKMTNGIFYNKSFDIDYNLNQNFHRAISIANMGIFFLLININNEGDLFGNVLIVNNRIIATQYHYSLEICNLQCSMSYKGMVLSGRTCAKKLNEKCLHVNNSTMTYLLKPKNCFTCNLVLTRIPDLEESLTKSTDNNLHSAY